MTTNLRMSCYASLVPLVLTAMVPAQQTNPPAPSDPFAVLAAKEPQEPVAGGMRVVVQKPDGSPAADAIVVFTLWRDDEAARAEREAADQQYAADEPRRFALRAAHGTRYLLDERGASRVPKKGHVFAFAGDMAAYDYIDEDSTEPRVVLQLRTPRTLSIEVATADGKPAAGLPFTLRDTPRYDRDPDLVTGADGTATLRLLRTRPDTAFVQFHVATSGTVETPLRANDARVRMQLPPTTVVEATLDGELSPGAELDWHMQCGIGAPTVAGQRTSNRSARWPFVAIGTTYTITAELPGLDVAASTGMAKASANAAPVALVRTPGVPTFAMQILAPDGKPACNVEVEAHWRIPRWPVTSWGLRTNREGWIELAMQPDLAANGNIDVLVMLAPSARGPMLGFGKVILNGKDRTRTVMPPLRCKPPLVVAAGMIVTHDDDQPMPNFTLGVYSPTYQRVTTDAAGRFEVLGVEPKQPISLRIDEEWCFATGQPWSTELEAGTKDARLAVKRTARVRLGAGLPSRLHTRIRYRLEPAGGDGDRIELESLGAHVLYVPPGRWNFVAHIDGNELLNLPDLRAESGVETHDPRFMAFDWRAYAVLVKVTVRDAQGAPCDACNVWLRNGGSGSGRRPTNGVLHVLLPKDGARIDIEPNDKKIASIDLGVVAEDQVVVLGGGPPIEVTVAPKPKLPEGVELLLVLANGDLVPFDANGAAVIVLPEAGAFTPRLSLRKGNTTIGPMNWALPSFDVPKAGKKVAIEVTAERQREIDGILALLRG